MGNLPNKVKIYISIIGIIALSLLIFLFINHEITSIKMLIFWGVLAVVTESLRILLPSGVGVSVGFAISLSSLIIGGPLLSALVTGIGVTFRVTDISGGKRSHLFNSPISKTIFNASQGIISAGIAGIIYVMIGGSINSDVFQLSLIAVLVTILVYILLNSCL